MSTLSARQIRAQVSLAKHEKEKIKANIFAKKILLRAFEASISGGSSDKFPMTLRKIKEDHGILAVEAFQLIFKRLQRGGITHDGKPILSQWVYNRAAGPVIQEWGEDDESTIKTLLLSLRADTEVNKLIYSRVQINDSKQWFIKEEFIELTKDKSSTRSKYRKSLESVQPRTLDENERYWAMK